MPTLRYPGVLVLAVLAFTFVTKANGATPKPQPDAQFGQWAFKTPDPTIWKRTEKDGAVTFSVDMPPGDFCTLTLFAGTPAQADLAKQFNDAVAADQAAKDTIKIEADSGAKPSKSEEGHDLLTRNLRSETQDLHTYHLYFGGSHDGRFDLAAFQTTSEETWKYHGAAASEFLRSLKLVAGPATAETPTAQDAPPSLPGFDEPAPAAPAASSPAKAATPPVAAPVAPAAPAATAFKHQPLESSAIVVDNAVIQKNGKPVNGVKLSQHDMEIYSPSLAVESNGTIHAVFVEQHKTSYALAVYHRSSKDGGATWTDAKNLSEAMPKITVGKCQVLADRSDRVYVIWRAGLGVNFGASPNSGGASQSNLMYRVLENGKWSGIKPVHPPGSTEKQIDGSISYFANIDAAGRAQVVWNTNPAKWHPELTVISGTYQQMLPGVGNGLVFQATLDGATPSEPKEVFLTPVGGLGEGGGYGTYCDGLDALNGYVDAEGVPHFLAAVTRTKDYSLKGISRYQLVENQKYGPFIDFPELSFHSWASHPRLLVDAAGRQHVVALYPSGERPNIRDYVLGKDEEPTIIREAAGGKGTVDGFQAYQGPAGRMIAIMQMNDSGERATGETYVSVSTGDGWSTPVNVTNNLGRRSFASKQVGSEGNISLGTSYYPGPAAATFDRDGHLLLLMINKEYGLFGSSAFGISIGGGSTSTPTLQFLKF